MGGVFLDAPEGDVLPGLLQRVAQPVFLPSQERRWCCHRKACSGLTLPRKVWHAYFALKNS